MMKSIALTLALATLAVSCNGNSTSGKKDGPILDQATIEKFEKELSSRRAGMVTLAQENGTYASLEWNESTGKFEPRTEVTNTLEKNTILKIDGDLIYTLSEDEYSRTVRKESIKKLIKEFTEELPEGSVLSIVGSKLNLQFPMEFSFDYEDQGSQLNFSSKYFINASLNLEDIRCSEDMNVHAYNSATVDGYPYKLPETFSATKGSCAPSISKADLKKIDLKDIYFCDETVETNDEDESNCTTEADLSVLVND